MASDSRRRDLPPRVWMVLKRSGGGGGLQRQGRRVALAMRERGVPVTLLSHARTDEPRDRTWARRLPTRYLSAADQWGFARRLHQYLCRFRHAYDVVHVHGFGLETFAAVAARRVTGKPVVVKPSTAGEGTKLDVYARWTEALPPTRRAWLGVDAWICISEQTRQDVLRLGAPDNRVFLIPNGVDTTLFRPIPPAEKAALRSELGVAPDEPVICTAARLTPHKRVGALVEAFVQVAGEFPQARLWIMGAGEERAALERQIAAAPAGERILLCGLERPGRVVQRFQAADIFALLSRWEGLSNALLEAMACGLAPVVTDVSGMQDVVSDHDTGRTAPVDDEAATAAVLRDLLRDPAGRDEMARRAARRVQEEYSLRRTVSRLLEVYAACRR